MTTTNRQPTVLSQLRALMPGRPVTRLEALHIAERQASKLVNLAGITVPPLPEGVVATLPRTRVERHSPLPVSGYTRWVGGRWQVVLNGAEPLVRQRFSLLHELKHIIDHDAIRTAYALVDDDPRAWVERLCDYFAACALMPKTWVKAAYCSQRVQDLPTLARRFGVSQMAMRVRLLQLGLIDPAPRCRYRRVQGRPADALDIYIIQPLTRVEAVGL